MADTMVADRVKEAYIRPIRTVLAVDDDFHQYDAAKPGTDPERAKALWQACRKRGLLCDIDDGSGLIAGTDTPHLLQSDLVILDYHLQGDDPRWSLGLLRRLADSEHASLVVVYTKDKDVLKIRRFIAAHLRGVPAQNKWFGKEEFANAWNAVSDKINYTPTEKLIEAYIQGNKSECRSDKPLQDELKRLQVPGPAFAPVMDAVFEAAIIKQFAVTAGSLCESGPILGGSEISPWVYANNLFVVCVIKTAENKDDGELVFTELHKALCDWNPDFMLSSVAFARGEFARGGFGHERASLSDPFLQAGWLYHAWAGSADERGDRLRVLFERIVTSYAARVLERVIEFGSKHVPHRENPGPDLDTLNAAIKHFFADPIPEGKRVLHVLNEFLVLEDLPTYVKTGTIFAVGTDGNSKGQAYICVTPVCDLVPRVPRGGSWEKQIHPFRPMTAMRCRLTGASEDTLKIAEQSRCVFITIDEVQKTLLMTEENAPVPALEWFVMEDMGKIKTDNTFKALAIDRVEQTDSADGSLKIEMATMRVLGQLRDVYASRLLQLAGQHQSRIGVDFVNLPKAPSDEKGKPKK